MKIDNSEFIKNISLPQDCADLAKTVYFKKGQIISQMGAVPEFLYYIRSGTVRVVQLSEEAERLVLLVISKNHFVCETHFLAELPLSFQLESFTDTTLAAFSRPVVNSLICSCSGFRRALFGSIALKMRTFGNSLLENAYESNTSRLLSFLQTAATNNNGVYSVEISQQELAEHLGIHRITVNRILHKLESQGDITINRRRIEIL